MSTNKEIRVINIISNNQVVLNCGSQDGIKEGDRFFIYGIGEMMKDPNTGEDLEKLELVRGTGVVAHVQQKICTVYSEMEIERPKTITRKKNFNLLMGTVPTEETEMVREVLPFDEPQIGDYARKLES